MIAINNTKLKIKRNNTVIHFLEMENKITKVEMVVKYRLLKYNTDYIAELKKINELELLQMNNYDFGREYDINLIVNNLNKSDLKISDLETDLLVLKKECIRILNDLCVLNRKILNSTIYKKKV